MTGRNKVTLCESVRSIVQYENSNADTRSSYLLALTKGEP